MTSADIKEEFPKSMAYWSNKGITVSFIPAKKLFLLNTKPENLELSYESMQEMENILQEEGHRLIRITGDNLEI